MNFGVRNSTIDDEKAVGALLEQSYGALWRQNYEPEVLDVALPLMTQANPALLASDTYYVAETASGEIIGCGGWTFQRPGSGELEAGLAHLRHFATHPDRLRQKVGQRIYARCERDARRAGAERWECYSSIYAVPFYEALGLRVIKTIEIELSSDASIKSVMMAREFQDITKPS